MHWADGKQLTSVFSTVLGSYSQWHNLLYQHRT